MFIDLCIAAKLINSPLPYAYKSFLKATNSLPRKRKCRLRRAPAETNKTQEKQNRQCTAGFRENSNWNGGMEKLIN